MDTQKTFVGPRRYRVQLVGLPPIPGVQSFEVANGKFRMGMVLVSEHKQLRALGPLARTADKGEAVPIIFRMWNRNRTRYTHSSYTELENWKTTTLKTSMQDYPTIEITGRAKEFRLFHQETVYFVPVNPISLMTLSFSELDYSEYKIISRWNVIYEDELLECEIYTYENEDLELAEI